MLTNPVGVYVAPFGPERESILDALTAHGIQHVGTDGVGNAEPAQLAEFATAVERRNMAVVSCHGVSALIDPASEDQSGLVERMKRDIDRTRAWGARFVVFHHGSVHGAWWEGWAFEQAVLTARMGEAVARQRMIANLRHACEYAARYGITVALENVPVRGQRKVAVIRETIRQVSAPNLGICFDSGHAHMSGLDVAAEVRNAGSHLVTSHLHDNVGGDWDRDIADGDLHLIPGLGTINWIAVLRAFHDIGFAAPFVFEGVLPGPRTGHDLDGAIDLLLRNWQALRRLAEIAPRSADGPHAKNQNGR